MVDYRKQAKTISKRAKELGVNLGYSHSLEIVASLHGYDCWAALKSKEESKKGTNKNKTIFFKEFSQSDWMHYGAAEQFKDGSSPKIAVLTIVDGSERIDCDIIIDQNGIGFYCDLLHNESLELDSSDTKRFSEKNFISFNKEMNKKDFFEAVDDLVYSN